MNLRLGLVVGALSVATLASTAGTAEAGRGHMWFGGGGGFHARASVGVHWSSGPRFAPRTSWGLRGHIYVGNSYYPRYYRPYYYYPTYVPSYYGESNYYYPVAPAPAAGPGVAVAVVDPRPELPKFGIGLFAGGVSVQDQDDSSDLGVLGRLRLGDSGLLVEGELGKTSYANDLRVDRRLGASLIWEIGARNRLAPYVLAGLGVQQADVAGDYTTTQNFAEVGVGLRYAITPNFHLTADVRAGNRNSMSSDAPDGTPVAGTTARTVAPPSPDSSDANEGYTRARLAAVLYF